MISTTRKRAKRTAPANKGAAGGGAGSGPVSVVLPPDIREQIRTEAERRGLGISPVVRVLVIERLREIADEAQLSRAEQWQRAQAWATFEQTRSQRATEVSRADLAALFTAARTVAKRRG